MSEKLLEMRHFRVLLYSEEPELAPPGPPESFRIERTWKKAAVEAVGCTIDGGQQAKMEVLGRIDNARDAKKEILAYDAGGSSSGTKRNDLTKGPYVQSKGFS